MATDLPEVKFYTDQAYVAPGHDEFTSKFEQAIREDSAEARQQRSDSIRGETSGRRALPPWRCDR